MSPMVMAPMMPAPSYTAPVYDAPPQQFTAPPWQGPAAGALAAAEAQPAPPSRAVLPPRPVVRGQIPDDPITPAPQPAVTARPSSPLSMPSPQELGITGARAAEVAAVDWTNLHGRLQRLGATSTHCEKLAQGGYRFTCLLPTDAPERLRRVEAEASSEAEAVRLVLDRAEAWVRK